MAANNKQYLAPGYGVVDEKNEDEQWLIPGYGVTDEEAGAAPAPAVGNTRRRKMALQQALLY